MLNLLPGNNCKPFNDRYGILFFQRLICNGRLEVVLKLKLKVYFLFGWYNLG